MSEQKPEKPTKAPPWWVPLLFAAVVGWLLNNFITIATFVVTGVVNLSHIGIGPFLLALGLSVVCGVIGVIIGIRLCLTAIFYLIAAIFHSVKLLAATLRQNQETQEKQEVRVETSPFDVTETDPPTGWEAIRYRASETAYAVLAWLLIPKWPNWPR